MSLTGSAHCVVWVGDVDIYEVVDLSAAAPKTPAISQSLPAFVLRSPGAPTGYEEKDAEDIYEVYEKAEEIEAAASDPLQRDQSTRSGEWTLPVSLRPRGGLRAGGWSQSPGVWDVSSLWLTRWPPSSSSSPVRPALPPPRRLSSSSHVQCVEEIVDDAYEIPVGVGLVSRSLA